MKTVEILEFLHSSPRSTPRPSWVLSGLGFVFLKGREKR